jgi:NADH-quinone oxidoreductase subunit N
MPFENPNVELMGIAPEIALSVTALVLMVLDAFVGDRPSKIYLPVISTIGLGIALYLCKDAWETVSDGGSVVQLSGMVAVDQFSLFVKASLAIFGLFSVWLAREYLVRDHMEEAEFYALMLFAVAGMMLMAAATDLIVMFVALETFSIALYVLVGFKRGSLISQESAMKYFLLGAFSSAFFLLGIALTYGATGSTSMFGSEGGAAEGITNFLRTAPAGDVGFMVVATAFLIVGLGFKVAAVPFHMWTPDAYQGAPSPVTGFMAAGSKFAGFAAILRLLDVALFSLRWDWRPIIAGIAIATMVVGSVFAVVQEDVKRMLAYSSIAHAGFVLTGVLAANDDGISGSLFYLATYGVTVLGAFAIVSIVGGRDEQRVRLLDYKGLFYRRPLLAAALSLFLLSLAGVPLTSGFVAKLVVFGPAIDAGYSWVVIVGALASTIAAFFYLRVMVVMYMQEPDEDLAKLEVGPIASGVVTIAALATLALGLIWAPLFSLTEKATLYFSL